MSESHCRHCDDPISGTIACEVCNRKLRDQCWTCHAELAHGRIKNQNIHVCGSGRGPRGDGGASPGQENGIRAFEE